MIGEIVIIHTIIQGNKSSWNIASSVQDNQIQIHVTKDTGVINQISIIVGYTFNEKVYPFSINLWPNSKG